MSVSVTAPFSPALDRTSTVLFRPFDFAKWITLGVCAWLVQLGDGGGGGLNIPTQFNARGLVGAPGPQPQGGRGGAAARS